MLCCPMCDSWNIATMGKLAATTWFRCNDCSMDFHLDMQDEVEEDDW
jgi:hypothetical protein